MGQAERQVLRGFVLRNREATPERPPRPVASVDVVGQLPEPFTRRPGARKTGQSPGWIDLPLPDKKRLIEL
jgi:hypothetical protein